MTWDTYGSHSRDVRKRILEKPAGDFKPYNRRQPSPCFELSHVIAVLVLVGLVVLGLWVGLGR